MRDHILEIEANARCLRQFADIGSQRQGERQIEIYLPRGDFGLIMMSYFGIVLDLSSRSLISIISRRGTRTPIGYAFSIR